MEEQRPDGDVLILENELILDTEPEGKDALKSEPGVLLLSNELSPEPVVKKIEVGPRVSSFGPAEIRDQHNVRSSVAIGRQVQQPSQPQAGLVWRDARPSTVATVSRRLDTHETGQPPKREDGSADLAQTLSEARAFANDYGAMKARTRKALYDALGRTYDFTIHADGQPSEYARLIEDAGLTVLDRAPLSPIVKLVFGADYDRTRVAEFAAAIMYGRRRKLPVGSFAAFLDQFEGGLKAVIGLERLMRKGEADHTADGLRVEARPAIARKLREIAPMAWDDIPSKGAEFTLLVARRLHDGSIAMLGEVPRDIVLLEKAARKLLAELDCAGEGRVKAAENYTQEV